MIPISDAAVSPLYAGVIAIMGTQMGKTAGLLNICGRKIDDDPAPVLWVGPTKSNVDSVIEPAIEAMIENSPSLKHKRPQRRRHPKHAKTINGVSWRLAWAGSATELASMPAHTVVVDELDKMKPIPGHGDVMIQAEARTSNYVDSVVIGTSSPTDGNIETMVHGETGMEHWALADAEEIASPIWLLWQLGTRFEWCVPCLECGQFFAPRLAHLTGWESGASPIVAKRRAVLKCFHCGHGMKNNAKEELNRRGQFVAPGQWVDGDDVIRGDPPVSEWATFWVSGLCSPWVTFGERAHAWIRAARSHDQETIRSVVNTAFGQLYRTKGDAPPWEDLHAKSEGSAYNLGDVPIWALLVFLTVDVQKDHLVLVWRGWGYDYHSILIGREQLWGGTDEGKVWRKLDKAFERELAPGVYVDAICVDAGYRPERVYDFVSKHQAQGAYASLGRDRPNRIYAPYNIETTRRGKRLWGGMQHWVIDHGYFKGWVHDRIKYPEGETGAWLLPKDVGDDYCKQVVNEQRVRTAANRNIWVKRGVNDYLDCEGMQVFLAHVEGVRNLPPPGGGDDDDKSLEDLAREMNE